MEVREKDLPVEGEHLEKTGVEEEGRKKVLKVEENVVEEKNEPSENEAENKEDNKENHVANRKCIFASKVYFVFNSPIITL